MASVSAIFKNLASLRLVHPVNLVSKESVMYETNMLSVSGTSSRALANFRRSVAERIKLERFDDRGAVLGGIATGRDRD